MKRKRRTKIFVDYANDQVIEMAKEIKAKYEIEMIKEPGEGLVMVKVRETAKNTLFYMGEVLVSETKVRIGDSIGIGLVKGNRPDLSEAMAIADAAFEENLPDLAKWIPIFEDCERQGLEKLAKKRSLVARTKVDFEMMDE